MKRIVLAALLASLFVGTGLLPAGESEPYAYHLRVVRVSGAGTDPGTALGWAENGGIPVVLPDEEAWGSAEQLDVLADALNGERADAVTGFYVTAGESGARFDRRVYVAGSVLDLSFEAFPSMGRSNEHLLALKLDASELEQPLAEARLLVRTERTVAIASPSPVENDWIVLAVTLVDQRRIDELRHARKGIRTADDEGVVKPKVIHKESPKYPEAARKDGIQGTVNVMATIDTQGIPRGATVVSMSPGAEELAASAVDAVQRWRYEPATLNGRPVEVMYTMTVQFRLE